MRCRIEKSVSVRKSGLRGFANPLRTDDKAWNRCLARAAPSGPPRPFSRFPGEPCRGIDHFTKLPHESRSSGRSEWLAP
jgi:hypothetical protein